MDLFPIFAPQTHANMSVRFTLEKRTNKFGECPIRLSWSFGGHRYQTTIGYSIMETDWDEKNNLVKPETKNQNGQSADDINFYIKRIGLVVTSIEQHFVGKEKAIDTDTMKQAVCEALSKDIARPEDIVERCLNGIVSIPEPTTRYYRDLSGRYYQFLCDARNFYASHDKYFILQELFGAHERVAVPISKFKPEREIGSMYPITKFEEVSKEEAFGKTPNHRIMALPSQK